MAGTVTKSISPAIRFRNVDIVAPLGQDLTSGFDVVIDKGTFDAISLRKDADDAKKRYRENVNSALGIGKLQGQLLILISCNFTREELVEYFACSCDCGFKFIDEIYHADAVIVNKLYK